MLDFKLKRSLRNSFISLAVIFALIFTFTVSIQAEEVAEADEIEEYLESVGAGNHIHSVMAALESYEGDDLAVETIESLIDELVNENMDTEGFYTAITNIVRAQNAGISAEELDEFNESLDSENNHGHAVSQNAHELAEFASNEENDREAVKEMAQELTTFAGENENIGSEDVSEFVKEKRAEAEERKEQAQKDADEAGEPEDKGENAGQAGEGKDNGEEAKGNGGNGNGGHNQDKPDDKPGESNPNN
ncbi:MAG: hypothetical protein ACQEQP_07335 [Bacillota bacterium]